MESLGQQHSLAESQTTQEHQSQIQLNATEPSPGI